MVPTRLSNNTNEAVEKVAARISMVYNTVSASTEEGADGPLPRLFLREDKNAADIPRAAASARHDRVNNPLPGRSGDRFGCLREPLPQRYRRESGDRPGDPVEDDPVRLLAWRHLKPTDRPLLPGERGVYSLGGRHRAPLHHDCRVYLVPGIRDRLGLPRYPQASATPKGHQAHDVRGGRMQDA